MGDFALLKTTIVRDLRLQTLSSSDEASLQEELATYVEDLIQHDFPLLVELIYRVDINESKLKAALQNAVGNNSALLIARMIIDRQIEKITTRQQYVPKNPELNDDEKW